MIRPDFDTILQPSPIYKTLLEETAQIINFQAGTRGFDVNLLMEKI